MIDSHNRCEVKQYLVKAKLRASCGTCLRAKARGWGHAPSQRGVCASGDTCRRRRRRTEIYTYIYTHTYIWVYIYLVTYIRRGAPVGPSVERRGARRAGSSLVSLVPRRSEPLVSPHFVAPPTSPLCARDELRNAGTPRGNRVKTSAI